LENIVNKTNIKLGGLNYNILLENPTWVDWFLLFSKTIIIFSAQKWISSGNRLFLGLDVSHPAPLKKYQIERGEKPRVPSVVGVCKHLLLFCTLLFDYSMLLIRIEIRLNLLAIINFKKVDKKRWMIGV
jgi:hypothetical protein